MVLMFVLLLPSCIPLCSDRPSSFIAEAEPAKAMVLPADNGVGGSAWLEMVL